MNEPGGDPAPILAEADLRAAVERLPFPLAAGGGATLRPMTTDDVDAAATWLARPEVARFTSRPPLDRDGAAEVVAALVDDPTRLALVVDLDGRTMGEAGGRFTPAKSIVGPTGWWEFSLGYACHPEVWGRGLATRVAAALCGALFTHLPVRRVTAMVFGDHAASARVLTKVGFREEGRAVQAVRSPDGTWWDDLQFALLRDEWAGPTHP